jgi:peptidoglycan-associated lipoprotein
MKGAISRWLFLAIATFALAGCDTLGGDKDEQATTPPVEERGISGDEMEDIDAAAQSRGLEDEGGFTVSSLDDPDSPLSVRVIYFDYDSSTVRAEFRPTVEAHAVYLANHADVKLTLEGHADERGSREYNLALGEGRALAVRRQLVLLGASAGQIRTVSYGEERPVVEGHEEQSYALNRRVEILYD